MEKEDIRSSYRTPHIRVPSRALLMVELHFIESVSTGRRVYGHMLWQARLSLASEHLYS